MEPPIGSIIAFAGPAVVVRDPNDPEQRKLIPNAAFEGSTGWMLCNGRPLDGNDPAFKPLFDAIGVAWGHDRRRPGFFNIPDLLGYFLRGVEYEGSFRRPRDRDGDVRDPISDGGNAGRLAGSVQGPATQLPWNAFFTSSYGDHRHRLNFEIDASREVGGQGNTVAFPHKGGLQSIAETEAAGIHRHKITDGGDNETRPLNAYVFWLIRFR